MIGCNCNEHGTLNNFCDPITGRCLCKDHVVGSKCNQCQEDYEGFPFCRPKERTMTTVSTIRDSKAHCEFMHLSIMIAGGSNGPYLKTSEVVLPGESTSDLGVSDLPYGISGQPSLILTPDKKILLCGGNDNEKKCLEMKNNVWEFHSFLKEKRRHASAVSMDKGVFLFGGYENPTSWEWLPNGSNEWQIGLSKITSPGFMYGCTVKVSEYEIALIGGATSKFKGTKKLLTYNIETENWKDYGDILKMERKNHACVSFNNKIIITGGNVASDSTEIIDINDLTNSISSGKLNQERRHHGLAVAHIGSKRTAVAFGGHNGTEEGYLDSIELWDDTTENWTLLASKLETPKESFGHLAIPFGLLSCS